MTNSERDVLRQVLSNINGVNLDLYVSSQMVSTPKDIRDFRSLGKVVFASRMLSEFIGCVEGYLLPGEEYDYETAEEDLYTHVPTPRSADGQPTTVEERQWLQTHVLNIIDDLLGIGDVDNAVLRCARRMMAEVIRYQPLSHYRLMMEQDVKPLYLFE